MWKFQTLEYILWMYLAIAKVFISLFITLSKSSFIDKLPQPNVQQNLSSFGSLFSTK